MNTIRDLKTMERCPYCKSIMNLPRLDARYADRDGVRYVVTTKRVTCPACGWARETEHVTRSYVREMEGAK